MRYIKTILNPARFYSYLKKSFIEYTNRKNNLKLSLFVTIQDCKFGLNNFIGMNVSLYTSSLGDFSYVGANTIISSTTIGKFCSIGMNVQIGLAKHPIDFVSTHPAFYSNNKEFPTFADKMYFHEYENIIIENDVWIGNNVIILGNIKVGNGSIISTGSVVTKDVLPYSIVGGVPAKFIKYRFDEEKIEKLLNFQWWNKNPIWLKANFKRFHSIDSFWELIEEKYDI